MAFETSLSDAAFRTLLDETFAAGSDCVLVLCGSLGFHCLCQPGFPADDRRAGALAFVGAGAAGGGFSCWGRGGALGPLRGIPTGGAGLSYDIHRPRSIDRRACTVEDTILNDQGKIINAIVSR